MGFFPSDYKEPVIDPGALRTASISVLSIFINLCADGTGAELELPGEVTYFKGTSSAKEGEGKITLETHKESRILDQQTAGEMHILIIPIQILLNYFQYLDFKNNVLPL